MALLGNKDKAISGLLRLHTSSSCPNCSGCRHAHKPGGAGFEGQDTDYGRCPILCVVLFVELVYQSDNIDIEEEDMQALRDRDLTQDVAKRLEPQMTLEAGVTVWYLWLLYPHNSACVHAR